MAADDNRLMMTPAGWEGFSWAAGGFLRPYLDADGEGDEKKGTNVWWCWELFVSLRRGLCAFAAIDGCDETREQPRTAAGETQRGRPGTAADGNERGGRGWLLTRRKEGGQGWLLMETKEGRQGWLLTRRKEGSQGWLLTETKGAAGDGC